MWRRLERREKGKKWRRRERKRKKRRREEEEEAVGLERCSLVVDLVDLVGGMRRGVAVLPNTMITPYHPYPIPSPFLSPEPFL